LVRVAPAVALVALMALACGNTTGPLDDYPYPVGRITLSHLPVDPDRVVSFMGLGNLNVLPEDHGGFYLPAEGILQAPTIPVYAPADGKIILVGQDWYPNLAPHGHDLMLEMRVSTTMTVAYGHMSDFTPEIWEAAGLLQVGYGIVKHVDIEVTAGQVVGYVGTQGALDWHINDSELQLSFANRSRYPDPWLISGCYEDYYAEPLRSRLLAITLREGEPPCGKIDYDVPGRIIGNWFMEGEVPAYAFEDYSTHLAIVYDELYGDLIAISDGIAIRPTSPHEGDEFRNSSRVFWVDGNSPAPETVGMAQGLVKYTIMDRRLPNPWPTDPPQPPFVPTPVGVFLVEMLDPGRIRVERFMNQTAEEVTGFGANARVYVR